MLILLIIITTVWIPHAKALKAGEAFLEANKKFPTDRSLSKVLLDNVVAATKDGYKVVSANEVKEGKRVEFLAQLNETLMWLANEIEGYKYKIELYSSIVEAMAVLGLKPPE